ncbi:MAG: spermidine synthase [Candidatus Azotimanducaceae bacterium]|jgi:spermidine synthase
MSSWELMDTAAIPNNGGELRLFRRNEEFVIRISGTPGDLMSSRTHGSEDALGELACSPFANKKSARILVGGLGMGFTLATTLKALAADAEVTVAELVPGVVKWNQNLVGAFAGHPLKDKRANIINSDVGALINSTSDGYDAILLDVDNGPEGLTHQGNDNLYTIEGLQAANQALRPKGILAVWSASPSKKFVTLLKQAKFTVDERKVRAHNGKGAHHIIWLAKKGR